MKAFYYSLLRNHFFVGMPDGRPYRLRIAYILVSLLFFGQQAVQAQFGSDLGAPAVSTLAWDHISSSSQEQTTSCSIGLTKDGRVYTWGSNRAYTIHTQSAKSQGNGSIIGPTVQATPFYLPSPAGEKVVKVRVLGNNLSGVRLPTFFALTQSGMLYAWGINNGLVATAWPSVGGAVPADADTTKARRRPIQLTVPGESSFVDFATSVMGEYWVAIGQSGKAYHIGKAGGSVSPTTTFNALPLPSGVSPGFKYTNVWVSQNGTPMIYLKANDGNVYYTGQMGFGYNTAVPSVYPGQTTTSPETLGQVLTISPRLVPFPAGESIAEIDIQAISQNYGSIFARSVSGKAYLAGGWRFVKGDYLTSYTGRTFVVAPLKNVPTAANLQIIAPAPVVNSDSAFVLKQFVEVAMPPGASKVIHFHGGEGHASTYSLYSLIIGDNNKVYWSGTSVVAATQAEPYVGNFLELMRQNKLLSDFCANVDYGAANNFYTWQHEAINYRGAVYIYNTVLQGNQFLIISKSGRGYFSGDMFMNTGSGKIYANNAFKQFTSPYPIPIANEVLYDCNTSPGTGGPLGEPVSTPGVGVIDCSKTKLYPAPVQGTPSELSLLVTINVTTVGDFSPITISGSGMSLVSGFDKVTATTTGIQTFHIPIKYDGSTLTNNFQFTIGQAGSCSADLTNKPSNEITRVWSLNNCSAITPGVLSK